MLTLLIAVVVGLIIGFPSFLCWGVIWGVLFGLTGMIAAQIVTGLIVRRKINRVNLSIQQIMMEGQKQINRKINIFQQKPTGDIKGMQKMLEKEQEGYLRQAIKGIDALEPFCKWNLLMNRQIATMRMMYYYQLKDFAKVDELMDKAVLFDSRAFAIKIARMFKKEQYQAIDKLFGKKIRRFKGEAAVIPYGLYSWILVKQGRIDDAIKALVNAKKKIANETLVQNWEALVNGNTKKFSNAGLGEEWYALYLEEPKIKTQKARRGGAF